MQMKISGLSLILIKSVGSNRVEILQSSIRTMLIFTCFKGYYRVNYDQRNWNLIVQQLLDDPREISVINRAQLIDDAFNLARAGLLDYSVTFNLTRYLQYEVEYIPWKSAAIGFKFLDSMLCRTKIYGSFQVGLNNNTNCSKF